MTSRERIEAQMIALRAAAEVTGDPGSALAGMVRGMILAMDAYEGMPVAAQAPVAAAPAPPRPKPEARPVAKVFAPNPPGERAPGQTRTGNKGRKLKISEQERQRRVDNMRRIRAEQTAAAQAAVAADPFAAPPQPAPPPAEAAPPADAPWPAEVAAAEAPPAEAAPPRPRVYVRDAFQPLPVPPPINQGNEQQRGIARALLMNGSGVDAAVAKSGLSPMAVRELLADVSKQRLEIVGH